MSITKKITSFILTLVLVYRDFINHGLQNLFETIYDRVPRIVSFVSMKNKKQRLFRSRQENDMLTKLWLIHLKKYKKTLPRKQI